MVTGRPAGLTAQMGLTFLSPERIANCLLYRLRNRRAACFWTSVKPRGHRSLQWIRLSVNEQFLRESRERSKHIFARMWYKYIALRGSFYSFSHRGCIHVQEFQVGTLHWIHLHVPGDHPYCWLWRKFQARDHHLAGPSYFRWHYAGGTSSPAVITVTNPGNAALEISSIKIGGANPNDFASSTTCNSSADGCVGPVRFR